MAEALSIKGLRLLTISIGVATLVIIGTLAYSGYQEATYLMQRFEQQGFDQNIVMNSTHFSISGLDLSNRGVYPLTLAASVDISLDGVSLGSNSLGPLTIPPGDRIRIDFNLPVNIDKAMKNPAFIGKVLLNGTSMVFRFNGTAGMPPFLKGSVSGTRNNTIGPVFDGFYLRIDRPSPFNETHVAAPVRVEFTNRAPIPFEAPLSAKIAATPVRPTLGNYGSGVIIVSASPEQHYKGTSTIYIVKEAVERGVYVVELSLSFEGAVHSWRVTSELR